MCVWYIIWLLAKCPYGEQMFWKKPGEPFPCSRSYKGIDLLLPPALSEKEISVFPKMSKLLLLVRLHPSVPPQDKKINKSVFSPHIWIDDWSHWAQAPAKHFWQPTGLPYSVGVCCISTEDLKKTWVQDLKPHPANGLNATAVPRSSLKEGNRSVSTMNWFHLATSHMRSGSGVAAASAHRFCSLWWWCWTFRPYSSKPGRLIHSSAVTSHLVIWTVTLTIARVWLWLSERDAIF